MAIKAGFRPGHSQELGAASQALVPSVAAFPGAFAGSGIGRKQRCHDSNWNSDRDCQRLK